MPKPKIKVAIVQPFDVVGSIQRRTLMVASALREHNGFEFIFIVPKNGFLFTKVALTKRFKVYKTSSLRPFPPSSARGLFHLLKVIKSIPKSMVEFYKILKRERPDVIQLNGFICIQEAIVTAIVARKRFIWNLIGNLYPRFLIMLLSPLIRTAKIRVFVSYSLRSYYLGTHNDVIIREYVDTSLFNRGNVDRRVVNCLRKILKIEEDAPVLLSVGNISPVKGYEFLIESLTYLRKVFPNLSLIHISEPTRPY